MNDRGLLRTIAAEVDDAMAAGAQAEDMTGIKWASLIDASRSRASWLTDDKATSIGMAMWLDGFIAGNRYEQMRSRNELPEPAGSS